MKYYMVDKYGTEKVLSEQEVEEIWYDSDTEDQGNAVYDVEKVIYLEDEGEVRLWAYRIGFYWTTVPMAFRDMTIHWLEV